MFSLLYDFSPIGTGENVFPCRQSFQIARFRYWRQGNDAIAGNREMLLIKKIIEAFNRLCRYRLVN